MQESVVLMVLSILSAIAMSLLYVIQQDPSYLYYAIGTRIFAFLFGGVLSYFTEGKLLSLPLSKSIVSIVVTQVVGLVSFLIMIWMMLTFNGIQAETYLYGMQLFALISALFLWAGLYENSLMNFFLRFRGFTIFGRRSFHTIYGFIQFICLPLISKRKIWFFHNSFSHSIYIHHFISRSNLSECLKRNHGVFQ